MRKTILSLGTLIFAITLMMIGCSKPKETTVDKYISVKDGVLVADEMPSTSSDVNIEVTMNKKVIPGGTSIVNVDSPVTVEKVYVGVEDEYGYYEWVPSSTNYEFVILVNQDIVLGEEEEDFVILIAILDENGKVSEVIEKSVELIEVGTGQLQISLSFDNAKDVDLHVIEPEQVDEEGNELSFYDRHIYYGHRTSSNGGHLDLDSNPGCRLDYVNNENITYDIEDGAYVAPGLYRVYVDLYSNCSPRESPTNWVVSVFYEGALIAAQEGSNPASGTFAADAESTSNNIYESNLENLTPAVTFVIPDRGQVRTKTFAPTMPTEMDLEKMSMEK